MVSDQQAVSVNNNAAFGFLLGCFGKLFGFVFCSMFFGMGCFFLWMIALQPILKIQSAKSWVKTPCLITKSDVVGNDSYKVVIEYDYEFENQKYHGDQYNFFDMSTGGRTSKERIAAKFKEGSKKSCYVNPNQPAESVVDRNASATLWWGLFPLPFIAVGLIGYWAVFFGSAKLKEKLDRTNAALQSETVSVHDRKSLFKSRKSSLTDLSDSEYDEEDLYEEPGAITLKNDASPFGTTIVLFIIAAFWNGIISFFLFERIDEWKRFNFGFEDFVLVPFLLVGLGLIIGVCYYAMASLNPKPVVVLGRSLIPLGGTTELDWRFPSSIGSLRELKIVLTAEEKATYRRGTTTYTDEEKFYEEILLKTNDPLEIASGTIELSIPSDSMHSFSASHNEIIWKIELKGDLPFWPDISAEYPIRIVPH